MIACASVTKREIRLHYDLATPFYRLLWGPHIHHGVWDAEAPPLQATRRLIDRLAAEASVASGDDVLDVGCGMGGSSIELAVRYGCRVTGLTLSPVQRLWARTSAVWQGAAGRTRFLCGDAERIALPAGRFDVVWNVECSEHFFDKPAFFHRAAGWLRRRRPRRPVRLAGRGRSRRRRPGVRRLREFSVSLPRHGRRLSGVAGRRRPEGAGLRRLDGAGFAHLGDLHRPRSTQRRRPDCAAVRPVHDALPRPLHDAAEGVPHRGDALRAVRRG